MAAICGLKNGIGKLDRVQISFSPFRLAWPSLPTMMWSCTEIPSGFGHRDDLLRHLNVGARWCRIAGRVIVHQNNRRSRKFERPFDHFARINRRVVHRSDLLRFVGDELITLVEKEDAKFFAVRKRLRRAAIVEHG